MLSQEADQLEHPIKASAFLKVLSRNWPVGGVFTPQKWTSSTHQGFYFCPQRTGLPAHHCPLLRVFLLSSSHPHLPSETQNKPFNCLLHVPMCRPAGPPTPSWALNCVPSTLPCLWLLCGEPVSATYTATFSSPHTMESSSPTLSVSHTPIQSVNTSRISPNHPWLSQPHPTHARQPLVI